MVSSVLPRPTLLRAACLVSLLGALGVTTVLAQAPRVLVFSKTGGFRHTSIVEGVETIRLLGDRYSWDVTWTEDASHFTDEGLDGYAAVVFMSTTGDVLDSLQQLAFERFIGKGRGFVGVHAAADTEYEWPFYRGLVGRQFVQHPEHQDGTIYVVDEDFPGMAGFGDSLRLREEWYEYTEVYADSLNYLYAVDTASYSQRGWKGESKMGAFHPLGWWHEYGGGRSFYTGLGHFDATYRRPDFREHLAAGIHYAVSGAREMPQRRAVDGLYGIVYEVSDLPAATEWYERAFETAPTRLTDGYAQFDIAGVTLGLRPGDGEASAKSKIRDSKTGNALAYWTVADLADTQAWITSLGAEVTRTVNKPTDDGAGEPVELHVRDPWGNAFVLLAPVDEE